MSDPSSSLTLPCLKDSKDPKGLERAQGALVGPGTTWQGGVCSPGQSTCASPPGQGLPPRGSAGGPEGRLHTGRAAPSPDCRQRNRAAPPGPLGVLGRVPAGFLRGLLHRAALPRRSESRTRLPPHWLTRAAPPKSTCQSQRRFRPARPGRVAPGRPRRAQCGRQAGRASWSPPSRRPSGRPGRAPGSDARSGASWLLPRSASCQRWYRGAPAARRLMRLWRGGSAG